MSWARLLKRAFDIDIEHRPNCGGAPKIIAAGPAGPCVTMRSGVPERRRCRSGSGRKGESPDESVTGHWQNASYFRGRLTANVGNRRSRPQADGQISRYWARTKVVSINFPPVLDHESIVR